MFRIYLIIIIIAITSCNNNRFKNYVIDHRDDIYQTDENHFRIDSCNLRYYDYITIGTYDDSSYYMLFWGNRNSWQYGFKKDKYFEVDVRYERSKGNHVNKDIQVLYTLELVKLKKK